jgi:hypothetical protein
MDFGKAIGVKRPLGSRLDIRQSGGKFKAEIGKAESRNRMDQGEM